MFFKQPFPKTKNNFLKYLIQSAHQIYLLSVIKEEGNQKPESENEDFEEFSIFYLSSNCNGNINNAHFGVLVLLRIYILHLCANLSNAC